MRETNWKVKDNNRFQIHENFRHRGANFRCLYGAFYEHHLAEITAWR